jgi:hypothetical protein
LLLSRDKGNGLRKGRSIISMRRMKTPVAPHREAIHK